VAVFAGQVVEQALLMSPQVVTGKYQWLRHDERWTTGAATRVAAISMTRFNHDNYRLVLVANNQTFDGNLKPDVINFQLI
jgi:hypothetical protein